MKKTRFLLMLASMLALAITVQAQGPNNSGTYYSSADGKKGAALKTALFGIIKNHTVISYDGLIDAYEQTDTRPDGCVRDWYSNVTHYRHGHDTGVYKKEGDSYNREHSVPQSWFSKASPMKSDIVHVLPTDGYVNNRRSSYPLAEVDKETWSSANGYSKLGTCRTAGYNGTVFEPNDEIKGDMARIYFYMVTCYEDRATGWGHNVFSSDKAKGFESWYLALLMRWSKEDPIDEVEIARNNAVYQVQGNRNPFVDYPALEEYVWGSKRDVAFDYDDYVGGGGGGDIAVVEQPVFSPAGGNFTEPVTVTISCATEGATIYYTTNGNTPTTWDDVYESPITIAENTTLKAIATKDGEYSTLTSANFTFLDGPIIDEPLAVEIALNNTFFDYGNGSIKKEITTDLVGTQEGITVTYALGEGDNRFCNGEHIRLYKKNELTFTATSGELAKIEFTLAEETNKTLYASTGMVNSATWTGQAQSVTFYVDNGSGHIKISNAKVELDNTSAIHSLAEEAQTDATIWTLSGQRVNRPQHGLYIRNGKKFIVK